MIPTEKPVILLDFRQCLQFVCLCFDCIQLKLVKQENYSYTQSKHVRIHCSSCGRGDVKDTPLQPFNVFINSCRHNNYSHNRFHKINSRRHNNIMAFEIIRHYNANS